MEAMFPGHQGHCRRGRHRQVRERYRSVAALRWTTREMTHLRLFDVV